MKNPGNGRLNNLNDPVLNVLRNTSQKNLLCRSQWLSGLRRGSAAVCLLGLWVRIPTNVCISVSCERCGFSGPYDELITRPQESCPLWCVVLCDLETLRKRRLWPTSGRKTTGKNVYHRLNHPTGRGLQYLNQQKFINK